MVSAHDRMTLFLPGIGHAPDLLSAVVDDQQGSIADHRDAHGTAPDAFTGLIGNPSHQEVLVAAFRLSVCEGDANDFVAAAQQVDRIAFRGSEKEIAVGAFYDPSRISVLAVAKDREFESRWKF